MRKSIQMGKTEKTECINRMLTILGPFLWELSLSDFLNPESLNPEKSIPISVLVPSHLACPPFPPGSLTGQRVTQGFFRASTFKGQRTAIVKVILACCGSASSLQRGIVSLFWLQAPGGSRPEASPGDSLPARLAGYEFWVWVHYLTVPSYIY